jgi:clumping factor A
MQTESLSMPSRSKIMKQGKSLAISLLALSALPLVGSTAQAEQRLRVQVNQRGDFLLAGNTLGWDCGANAAAPLTGTVPTGLIDCGLNPADSSPDVFWRADDPSAGAAGANAILRQDEARSSAAVNLPDGAVVTHALLYWGARRTGSAADTNVIFERPGAFSQSVRAVSSYVVAQSVTDVVYQSVADVTDLVRANGKGVYRVSGVDVQAFPDANEDVLFAGWSLVVLYALDSDPPRNLAVFDGLDAVQMNAPSSVRLDGFLVPDAGFDAKLGAIVYEGDDVFPGDSLLLDGQELSDAQNPSTNFFNGSRSSLGMPVTNVGDLPRLSGAPRTMAGIDLDVIDVTARMRARQTSVDLEATSSLDVYFLGAFVTSISTFRPDFVSSGKTVRDVNGGVLLNGDVLEYTVKVSNTGNDASINTTLNDRLPMGVTLVPGSVRVASGPNQGAKTEAADADQASYDPATRILTVRLGAGATASEGGSIEAGSESTVVFSVKVDPTTRGVISNQGSIEARGRRGAPVSVTLTDGDSGKPGTSSTDIPVAGCMSDSDCSGSKPFCDVSQMPPVCVECLGQCPGPGSMCDPTTKTCKCGGLPMSCVDTDDDGLGDPEETTNGTNPNDADSDDDGVLDGKEVKPFEDSDGDGLINALDPDSDDDALFDGTELGQDCSHPATNAALGHCRADGDRGASKTDPIDADSDNGGVRDGGEDVDLDGTRDPGERNPIAGQGADDATAPDGDEDGLSDPLEETLNSDPNDLDSDDDGLLDGDERNPSDDTDGDGLINVLDVDSDDDGLFDGTESGKDCGHPSTMPGHCLPDGDRGVTTTSPVIRDTDRGGASDGSEDFDRDGVIDMGERNPTVGHGDDDSSVPDADGDGLSDPFEDGIGSRPDDADSDDDGLRDGEEPNLTDDTDADGAINVLDPDSDGDDLFDGNERGKACDDPATDASRNQCRADADMAKSTTSVVIPDTDRGGVDDGDEDENHDGVIDPGERNPNDPSDDNPQPDAGVDAGPRDAGAPDAGPRDSGADVVDAGYGNTHTVAGGGCSCSVAEAAHAPSLGDLLGFGALSGLLWTRRRRSARTPRA